MANKHRSKHENAKKLPFSVDTAEDKAEKVEFTKKPAKSEDKAEVKAEKAEKVEKVEFTKKPAKSNVMSESWTETPASEKVLAAKSSIAHAFWKQKKIVWKEEYRRYKLPREDQIVEARK